MTQSEEKIEGKLVPTLREGIDIIKMVLFKELMLSLKTSRNFISLLLTR